MDSSPQENLSLSETEDEFKKKAQKNGEIVFTNSGDMVVNNRSYRRSFKKLWRAVEEGRKSVRHYTKKKTNKSAIKKKRKQDRKNKKSARR